MGTLQVPPEKGYVVGDISIGGKGKIRYGGMIAEFLQIKLVGLAQEFNKNNVKPVCLQ
jgi:hypothetical protein